MSSSTIAAEVRTTLGSRNARDLRAIGRIPASIQGGAGDVIPVSIDSREFWRLRRQHVHLFDLEVAGSLEPATVRELQWDSLGENLNHVEFHRVVRGVKTQVAVSLEFVGHPAGGVLNHLHNEIDVRCLPSLIPDSIEVRVDGFEVGQTILAGSITLPEGFELASDENMAVAVVADTRANEVAATEEADDEDAEGDAPASDA
ncbi:MAG: large subunit ribosomal protein L25 [Planctomycetota bacterium]|jgi:large subunit ribosomal protein L25